MIRETNRVLVAVVRYERYQTRYHSPGAYSCILHLACGCERSRKWSQGVPKRCYCDCATAHKLAEEPPGGGPIEFEMRRVE